MLTISFWLAATCAGIHGHHWDDEARGRVHRLWDCPQSSWETSHFSQWDLLGYFSDILEPETTS